MSNDMYDTITEFSIVFRNIKDFNKAVEIIKTIVPDDTNVGGLEMTWKDEWYRNHAVHELENISIQVDAYEL